MVVLGAVNWKLWDTLLLQKGLNEGRTEAEVTGFK